MQSLEEILYILKQIPYTFGAILQFIIGFPYYVQTHIPYIFEAIASDQIGIFDDYEAIWVFFLLLYILTWIIFFVSKLFDIESKVEGKLHQTSYILIIISLTLIPVFIYLLPIVFFGLWPYHIFANIFFLFIVYVLVRLVNLICIKDGLVKMFLGGFIFFVFVWMYGLASSGLMILYLREYPETIEGYEGVELFISGPDILEKSNVWGHYKPIYR